MVHNINYQSNLDTKTLFDKSSNLLDLQIRKMLVRDLNGNENSTCDDSGS